MSPTYAFVSGAILLALAVLRVVWFLWRGANTREARLYGVGVARLMYYGSGALLLVCGMCFWGWGAMVFVDQRTPRPKVGQPNAIPKKATPPAASDYSLMDAIELEPGYWIRPPRDYLVEPLRESDEDGHLRRIHCWRHPSDAKRFIAYAFTDDYAPCSTLTADAPPGAASKFVGGHYDQLQRELGGPVLAPEGNQHLANIDGILMLNLRTRHGQMEYGGGYYAGCDDGRLIEYIWCEQGNSGAESSIRSLQRRGAEAEKSEPAS